MSLISSCRSLKQDLLHFVLAGQNQDGSWDYVPGKSGAVEPTALTLIALLGEPGAEAARTKGMNYLRGQQGEKGGWPVRPGDDEDAAWVTSLAGTTLTIYAEDWPVNASAARFVAASFAKNPRPWILRVADWMRSWDVNYVEENLAGWKWNPATANWVEPTSYAILYFKLLLEKKPQGLALDARSSMIHEAELLLLSRMCRGGGWNYGNARILGEELRPYPLTTANALIALQQTSYPEVQTSLEYLWKAATTEQSALALSVIILALNLYDRKVQDSVLESLTNLYRENGFFRNIKTASLAMIALNTQMGGQNPLLISRPMKATQMLYPSGSN